MRRNVLRLGALFTALFLFFSPTVPSALAAPSQPSHSSNDDILLVPRGTTPNSEQLRDIAKRLIADRLGRDLFDAWGSFRMRKYPPEEVAVAYLRFDWMSSDSTLPGWLRNQLDTFLSELENEIQFPSSKPKRYPLRVKLGIGDSAIYKRLGMSYTPGHPYLVEYGPVADPLLKLEVGSDGDSAHTERNIIEWLERTLPIVLGRIARTDAERDKIDEAVKTIIEKSGAALAGLRTSCGKCQGRMEKVNLSFPKTLAITFFDEKGTPDATRASAILHGGLLDMAHKEMVRLIKEDEARADQNMGQASPCSSANGSHSMAMVELPMASDCGESENSGLAQALASGTYGGVDFSSLQLRYMSDSPGSGVQYAFSGKATSPGLMQDVDAGRAALTDSAADLRTWLVLDPSKFWVNLNPDEPDRIIDAKLGQTNAGRALLEADWRMKQTEGRLLDPKTSFGAEYWRRLGGSSGKSCYSSRMWIVPGEVEVREDGDSLYVLKAELNVKAKAEEVAGLGQISCNADPAETARNERLEQEMMVPKIVKAVNTDPEYAPLRRAFLARVVAQWIRDRHADGHSTSFDKLIDSGDVGPASLHGSWQPKQVYDAYLHSINEGDFTYKRTTRVGNTTITYVMRTGGVDFSKLPSKKLTSAEMDRQVPKLSQTIRQAAGQPATASDGSVWLGDRAAAPHTGAWGRIRTYLGGRTGILIVVVVALGILLLFVRDGSAMRRGRPVDGSS
ncbi:hypothetical protein N8I84_15810 [Streptomyces cynarae]|uniref:Uncharacterized protein n=1 Tax=Streptomyces cynarae TaxID=2981134 RepID=A0ABY6E032_9ACTN|nr:hypothetical protein [Streptomyces cynarae]UXY20019.1 hypothetical protein N8I84_15810 [Streptomyces cynarae]